MVLFFLFLGNTFHCTITFTIRSRAVAAYFVNSNELEVVSSVRMSSMGCQGHKLLSTLSYLIAFTSNCLMIFEYKWYLRVIITMFMSRVFDTMYKILRLILYEPIMRT